MVLCKPSSSTDLHGVKPRGPSCFLERINVNGVIYATVLCSFESTEQKLLFGQLKCRLRLDNVLVQAGWKNNGRF